jgi:ribosomal protein S18 acetylase RimI-like enzyme
MDVSIERVDDISGLSPEHRARLVESWNPSARATQFAERFTVGSELWLAKVEGELAGFGWAIQGRTIESYFFPLQAGDVHLYDFYVFPEYRGRGVNISLLTEILASLSEKLAGRAFIECAAWNTAQIRSLRKTPFHTYAAATKLSILGKSLVFWHNLPCLLLE